jgi:phosphatidylglycerophosphate synthase
VAKVHLGPLGSAAGGIAGLGLLGIAGQLSPAGWAAGTAYLLVSNVLLLLALRRHAARRFGWANTATATRSTLVGLVTGLVVTSLAGHPISIAVLVSLAVPALALDAVDGWLARRTNGATALGARFDMEVDAYLLLVLSAFVAPILGAWVLAIGLMRYAYVAAGWLWPWLRGALPYRYWRKVVTAVQGIALVAAASGLLPTWLAAAVVGIALALLVESFGRDVLWLYVRQRAAVKAAAISTSVTANPTR